MEKGHEFSIGVDNVDILECIIIYSCLLAVSFLLQGKGQHL